MFSTVRPSIHVITILLLGFITISIGYSHEFILETLIDSLSVSDTSKLAIFLKDQGESLKGYGFLTIIGGFFIFFSASGIEGFIRKKVNPIVESHVSTLRKELQKSNEDTKALVSARVIDSVISATPPNQIKERLKLLHEKAYGVHCGNNQGLYTAVNEKLSPFFEQDKPHRSDYHQTVTVQEVDNESIKWSEVCSYKIHTVSLDKELANNTNDAPITHRVKYSTLAKVSDLSFEEDNENSYMLELAIDGIVIFNSTKHLTLESATVIKVNDEIEGVKAEISNSIISIQIDREHKIASAWTSIEIKETSVIQDDYFISSRKEPTCGARITIVLPQNWSFELIKFGHPDDWTIHQHPSHTLSAWTKTWLMPGITFFCRWERQQQQSLNLEN